MCHASFTSCWWKHFCKGYTGVSSLIAPPRSLILDVRLRFWDVLQVGRLTSISGSQAGGSRIEEAQIRELGKGYMYLCDSFVPSQFVPFSCWVLVFPVFLVPWLFFVCFTYWIWFVFCILGTFCLDFAFLELVMGFVLIKDCLVLFESISASASLPPLPCLSAFWVLSFNQTLTQMLATQGGFLRNCPMLTFFSGDRIGLIEL